MIRMSEQMLLVWDKSSKIGVGIFCMAGNCHDFISFFASFLIIS